MSKFSQNNIGVDGVRALTSAPHLALLQELYVNGNDIGLEGAQLIADSPYLGNINWI